MRYLVALVACLAVACDGSIGDGPLDASGGFDTAVESGASGLDGSSQETSIPGADAARDVRAMSDTSADVRGSTDTSTPGIDVAVTTDVTVAMDVAADTRTPDGSSSLDAVTLPPDVTQAADVVVATDTATTPRDASAEAASPDAATCVLGALPTLGTEAIVPRTAGPPFRFASPLFVSQPPSETALLYVVERGGRIQVVDAGVVSLFLDIRESALGTDVDLTAGDERGLLGLAFHPDWPTDRRFYVAYRPVDEDRNVVAEYLATDSKNASSTEIRRLVNVVDPYDNHNGGMIAFGPDGFLYVALGDGGSGGDPDENGLDTTSLLGKILRLDVDNAPTFAAAGNPFSTPSAPQIWLYGLRNPWRFSFDRSTGDMLIGDVGQGRREEIDLYRGFGAGGANFGWRAYEGTYVYDSDSLPLAGNHTPPIIEVPRDRSTPFSGACSITGGYVYRGTEMPALSGVYLFSDYCVDWIGVARICPDAVSAPALLAGWSHSEPLVSFGEDNAGNLYIVYLSGQVLRLRPT